MIAALVYMFALLAVGYAEGERDTSIINGQGKVDHPGRWKFRAFMALLLCVPTMPFLHWQTLLLLPVAYGTFSIAFRFTLNTHRGKDWRYISPSNKYDDWFLGRNSARPALFASMYNGHKEFRSRVHARGVRAYLTEWVAVLAAFVALYLTR